MKSVPESFLDFERVYFNPRLLDPSGIINPVGPLHLIAAWRSPLSVKHDIPVISAYDLLWVWSPESVVARIYFGDIEPRGALDYWRAGFLTPEFLSLDADNIANAIASHSDRVRRVQ